jgi:hypothetical protein
MVEDLRDEIIRKAKLTNKILPDQLKLFKVNYQSSGLIDFDKFGSHLNPSLLLKSFTAFKRSGKYYTTMSRWKNTSLDPFNTAYISSYSPLRFVRIPSSLTKPTSESQTVSNPIPISSHLANASSFQKTQQIPDYRGDRKTEENTWR